MSERIQKVLANMGVASRRQVEKMVAQGRISVNGDTAVTGQRIDVDDQIRVDGKVLKRQAPSQVRVIMYHKPVGQICTLNDPEGRETVFSNLPKIKQGRWINVGRLDINTSGLLLFTNNGELANQLMHPSSQVEREYAVRVLGKLTHDQAKLMTQGVELEDGIARFEHIVFSGGEGANNWYHVVVAEGRNRLVRRLFESQGFGVSRLVRVRYANLFLPKSLARGRARELGDAEIKRLL